MGRPSDDPSRGPEELGAALYTDRGDTLLAEPTADELIQAALDEESQKRLWLRAIIPLLQLRSHDSDPSGRVQLAFDLMHIAACERTLPPPPERSAIRRRFATVKGII